MSDDGSDRGLTWKCGPDVPAKPLEYVYCNLKLVAVRRAHKPWNCVRCGHRPEITFPADVAARRGFMALCGQCLHFQMLLSPSRARPLTRRERRRYWPAISKAYALLETARAIRRQART